MPNVTIKDIINEDVERTVNQLLDELVRDNAKSEVLGKRTLTIKIQMESGDVSGINVECQNSFPKEKTTFSLHIDKDQGILFDGVDKSA